MTMITLAILTEISILRVRGLIVNVFNVKMERLKEEAYRSPLILSALLTGKIVSDRLPFAGGWVSSQLRNFKSGFTV